VRQPPETPRIYTAQALARGAEIDLDEGPARHVAGALRLKVGAELTLFNGQGGEFAAHIIAVARRSVRVSLGNFSPIERESPLVVTLGLGISRGERMDYALQKCTELGVARVVPLVTERTEVRIKGERENRKRRHWQQVVISACEQCGRNRVPEVAATTPLNDWLNAAQSDLRLVLHHRTDGGLGQLPAATTVDLLVGPEGGLAIAEIDAARAAGFKAMALGPRVMRTETAPVAALSVLQFHWGDMQ
jgi:16S rRNA (uracil1498-N3)-methyltransferase